MRVTENIFDDAMKEIRMAQGFKFLKINFISRIDLDGCFAFFGTMIVGFILALAFIWLVLREARAEEGHTHEGAVGRFYESWTMPDNRNVSCCHKQDCDAAASKFENGSWFARLSDDGGWIRIPQQKIEQDRDSPDGRSHLCGRPGPIGEFTVFCFVRGGGV